MVDTHPGPFTHGRHPSRSGEEQRARWRELIEAAEARYPAPAKVLGRAGLLKVNPHDRPEKSKRSPAPAVHASSRAQRLEWREAYRAFVETYRSAIRALRARIEGCGFPPEGCRPVWSAPAPGG